jgi:hypothetical protein
VFRSIPAPALVLARRHPEGHSVDEEPTPSAPRAVSGMPPPADRAAGPAARVSSFSLSSGGAGQVFLRGFSPLSYLRSRCGSPRNSYGSPYAKSPRVSLSLFSLFSQPRSPPRRRERRVSVHTHTTPQSVHRAVTVQCTDTSRRDACAPGDRAPQSAHARAHRVLGAVERVERHRRAPPRHSSPRSPAQGVEAPDPPCTRVRVEPA